MKQNASSSQPPVSESHSNNHINVASPPPARLALRVGVTGHRPNKLQGADEKLLRGQIKTALAFIKETTFELHSSAADHYLDDPPVLRVISPVAEGADRFVAEEGLNLGFELHCPLPSYREEYEIDFVTEDSKKSFHALLSKATAILELDGSRDTAESPNLNSESYETAGRIMLNQSDVLIAIWDGDPGSKGGTGQIVGEAERLGIPVIWIESKSPHAINVILQSIKTTTPWKDSSRGLAERIGQLLAPPPQPKPKYGEKPKDDLRKAYFKESRRKVTLGFLWKLFRDLVADFKIRIPTIRLGRFEQSSDDEWGHSRKISPPLPEEVLDRIDTCLKSHYAWSDQLADYYANAYRSAFVFNYLMAGVAVLFAFAGYAAHSRTFENYNPLASRVGAVASFVEVSIIVAILSLTRFGNRKRWHERWIDFRLLAEQLRQQRFLMALGRVLPSAPRVPVYVSDEDPSNSWVQWHCRAIVRAAGLIEARFDNTYLDAVCVLLKSEGIDRQVDYHQGNAERMKRADNFLHHAGNWLFGVAAVACSLHLLNYVLAYFHLEIFKHEGLFSLILTLITVVGPAFGAALTAIRFQGEFERVNKRSRAMKEQLHQISEELEHCVSAGATPSSSELGEIATRGAQLMISEVLDWRTVFLERPLGLPS